MPLRGVRLLRMAWLENKSDGSESRPYLEDYSDNKNLAMSSEAAGRPSLLLFVDHSRHCAASLANAFCTAAITASWVMATTPAFAFTRNRAFPSSCPGMT